MSEPVIIAPETIKSILAIMGEPIRELSLRMDKIEISNSALAKEIHSTLRHLDQKYTQAEMLVESAKNEASRAIEAADAVDEKIAMCRTDEAARVAEIVIKKLPKAEPVKTRNPLLNTVMTCASFAVILFIGIAYYANSNNDKEYIKKDLTRIEQELKDKESNLLKKIDDIKLSQE